jgi:glycosyltransferase involved in cell wall biosynthesis
MTAPQSTDPLPVPKVEANEGKRADRVRVLHVITGLGVGGAESMLASVVGAHSTELDQAVVSLMPNGYHAPRIRERGTPVTELALGGPVSAPMAVSRLARIVSRMRPHVVQGWMYHGNLAALGAVVLSGRRSHTKLAWGIRCSDRDPSTESRQLRAVVRLGAAFANRSDILVANSQVGLDYHVGLGYRCSRTLVLHNGIDVERFRPDPKTRASMRATLGIRPDELVLAHVARVHPMKDHGTFVEAMRSFPGLKGLAVGAGTEGLPPLPNLLRLGRRSDVAAILAASDAIVSSSAFGEGFSNAIAEGMSTGLVAIATDVGDSKVIVGDTGWIVPIRSVFALREAITSLVRLPRNELARRGEESRLRVVSRFSLDSAVKAFTGLYLQLANVHPERRQRVADRVGN